MSDVDVFEAHGEAGRADWPETRPGKLTHPVIVGDLKGPWKEDSVFRPEGVLPVLGPPLLVYWASDP